MSHRTGSEGKFHRSYFRKSWGSVVVGINTEPSEESSLEKRTCMMACLCKITLPDFVTSSSENTAPNYTW